jgi:creatinine amidohydrolase
MFPGQLEQAFAACPVLYLSYGLCEPHGPQCALGLDALKAHAICVAAARAHGGIVAPPDYWHIHEIGGYAIWAAKAVGEVQRTWLSAMPPWQHFKNVLYQIRQADALGFKVAILLTGHYGPNWEDLNTLLRLVQPHVGTRLYSLPDFEANTPGFDPERPGHGGDHAGKVETSLLWALEPDCVDLSRIPSEPGTHMAMGKDAGQSNRQTGERMVEDEVRYLGGKARAMLADYDRLKPDHRLLTFADVERVWAEVVRPDLPKFRTMQEHWQSADLPPETSIWRRNMGIPRERGY